MRSIYVFYADVFLLQNLIMDFLALWGTNFYLRRGKRTGRLLVTALCFSAAGAVLFLWIPSWPLYCLTTHFLLNTAMVAAAFGIGSFRCFLENWWTAYLIVILTGGMMQWVREWPILPGTFVVPAFLTAGALFLFLRFLKGRKSRGNHMYAVKLVQGGRQVEMMAYWDSGNQLRDPYNGKYVNILDKKYAGELFGEEALYRYVPFCSLGQTNGMIKVATVDELLIFDENRVVHVEHAAVGVAAEELFWDREYGMILPAALLPAENFF